MSAQKQIRNAILGMIIVIVTGTVGFRLAEGVGFFDALWMTVTTVLTVGYGDMVPVTHSGKVFALTIIPLGVGLVTYAVGAAAAVFIEGSLSESVGRRRMERRIRALEAHIIVCGFEGTGQQVVAQLQKESVPVVVVGEGIKGNEELSGASVFHVEGDPTEDRVLVAAGIERASGLVAALPKDADNVFIVLTAKGLNPAIQVVAKAEKPDSEEKLRRAGADKVVNPTNIGGCRMAMSIIKPVSVEYIDTILDASMKEFSIEEVILQEGSSLLGRTLSENRIKERYGVTVVAIKRGDLMISNPLRPAGPARGVRAGVEGLT